MTFTPEADLKNHIRFIAEYEDGSSDVFAVPECPLQQGPMQRIARFVAREWQRDGFIKPGKIVGLVAVPFFILVESGHSWASST